MQPEVKFLYEILCDLTHPGASSVLAYARASPDQTVIVPFDPGAEKQAIAILGKRITEVIMDILYLAMNPGLRMSRTP